MTTYMYPLMKELKKQLANIGIRLSLSTLLHACTITI